VLSADDLIKRTKEVGHTEDEWVQLYEDICAFFDGDYSEEDKTRLREEGYLESVAMMANWLGCY
jgi:hypothetical protein